MHGTTTSTFALTEVRAACEPTEPPPPLKRWSARLVHWAQAPGQPFRVQTSVRRCRFSGLFYWDLLSRALRCPMQVAAAHAARTLRLFG